MAVRNQVDLKRMRYIVEVARAEAITTAAQTLAITQPALTRSIAEVERELGTKLFERLPRGIELTDAGRRFVTRAKQILGDVDDLVADIREGPDRLTGRLRIGIAPSGFLSYATATVTKLATEHAGVSIEVVTGSAQALCPRLIQGELNVIVGSSSYLQRWRELEVIELLPLHFACMLRQDHPLTQLDRIDESDVLGYPVVFPASVEPMYSDLAQRYVANGLPPIQPRYVTDDFGLVMRLVNATNAFYPLTHPSESFGGLDSRFLMLTDAVEFPTHHIGLAYSSLRPRSTTTQRFVQLLANQLGFDLGGI